MNERFPAVDERLAVAEPEPPPDVTRPTPAPVRRASAEAYMELLAGYLRELEEYLFDLTDRRDELQAEEEYLTARIRTLRRSVDRLEDEQGAGAPGGVDSAVWSRLWERPPRIVAERVDPTGGRSAGRAIADLRDISERRSVGAIRARRWTRVKRALFVSLVGVGVAGTLLVMLGVVGPGRAVDPASPGEAGDALARAASAVLAPAGDPVPATMPDVVGDRLLRATRKIADAGLEVVDLRLVRGREDVVLSSVPTAGEAVAAGAGVTLQIGRG